MENGRAMTGPFGFLVTRVINTKETYKKYVGVDACMSNLMRPGMYGAYHHITVLGSEDSPVGSPVDVVGSLCENNDKFAVDRELPEIEVGDVMVIHDAGAHGHAMGFQYNGRLRCAELLLEEDGTVRQIRRAETLEDYFATVEF
jgi:diaminopimelate decarboxylase